MARFSFSGKMSKRFGQRLSAAALLVILSIPTAYAIESCDPAAGQVVDVEGRVELQRNGAADWVPAKLQDTLCEGDTVRAAERSRAAVALANQAVLRIDQRTTVRLINIKSKPKEHSLLSLVQGAIQSFSRKPRQFEVSTPYLNGSIEGTEFVIRVAEKQTILTVFEGTVRAANDQGSMAVPSGHSVAAEAGKAPQPRTIVRPRDASQWALYYPPVLALGESAGAPASLGNARESAARGDYPAAFAALDGVPQEERDAQFHVLRASLLLSVGRIDEARADIDGALAQDASSGLGHALSAVIAVVSNDRDRALAEGRKAVELSPDSAAAYIALSYAQQARFDLPAARKSLLTAVKRQPKDALAWARLSELHLMFGNRRDAIAAAEKSLALAPGLGRAQMALGFAELADFRIAKAAKSFEKAIAADSADPLPHLGLGLTRINRGQLQAGRRDLEVAVALNGNSALLRAYLGKAYYEEKRSPLDAQQFKIAKEFDPKDPTAYLYDGIRLQTENQPVAALKEVNDSIKRNDNRAVYRSRLLLDSDEAARNVSLAQVYSDLGFQQLALEEGYESVNTDPSNSSAHRFLADSYSVLPRHEIARVSELLQAQLLDPLNLAPIQPRAAESNLYLISSAGPAVASADEFNSLFKRNQVNVILSGTLGEMATGSGDLVIGGISNNLSYSLGVSRFQTDGFRANNDQTDNIGNAFIQSALSPDTSVQFEYRHRDTNNGDLNQFMNGSFSTALRNDRQFDVYRGGLRHAFAPNSILLASVMYKRQDSTFHDSPLPGFTVDEQRPDNKGLGTELQYLYRSAKYDITAGTGYFDLNEVVNRTQVNPITCPTGTEPGCSTTSDLSAKQKNAYVYSNIRMVADVRLTLGASWDSYDTRDPLSQARDQVNPKLGVTWQVRPGTTVRAAGFRALKRSLITDQTLEPTQVAGFNQFYDDLASTDAWRYGIAMDQKFSQQVFGGVELSRRDLTVPFPYTDTTTLPPTTTLQRADWQEDGGRAYLFMTPSKRVALSMAYQYQRLNRSYSPATGLESVSEIRAHKLPLGIRYFTASGWTYGLKGTYVHENYDSGGTPVPGVSKQSSDFWVVDASVSYRLAGRRGFVAFGGTNLLDNNFAYQQIDALNPTMQPARMIYGRVTLYL
jgi:Tfp pilus assembly protein PilF